MTKAELEYYQEKIINKKAALENAKVINAKREELTYKYNHVYSLRRKCNNHVLKLEQLLKIINQEDAAFRERRIAFLNEHVTEELLKIFPSKGYEAKIDCDFKRSNGIATLTLKDKYGIERIPEITEGKLCQYLISFASTVGAVKGLGTNNIYIDEAFGVSSSNNLPKIGEIIANTVEGGLQIILISQNSGLYTDIPRREIHLLLDETEDVARVEKIEDLGEK
jgi:hypothetical protein